MKEAEDRGGGVGGSATLTPLISIMFRSTGWNNSDSRAPPGLENGPHINNTVKEDAVV